MNPPTSPSANNNPPEDRSPIEVRLVSRKKDVDIELALWLYGPIIFVVLVLTVLSNGVLGTLQLIGDCLHQIWVAATR